MKDISGRIVSFRHHNVVLDKDLADWYGMKRVELRQLFCRHKNRFPSDFLFKLTRKEMRALQGEKYRPAPPDMVLRPFAVTQQGIAMLSGVIPGSRRVAGVNVVLMRAFRERENGIRDLEVYRRLDGMRRKYDAQFNQVFKVIPAEDREEHASRRLIGFKISPNR
jgi:hypothetical protein